jgi:hypothetical protein
MKFNTKYADVAKFYKPFLRVRAISKPDSPFRFWHRTPYGDFILSQEPVMIDLHRVNFALAGVIVGLNGSVSHRAAGDGHYALASACGSKSLPHPEHRTISPSPSA